MSTMNEAVEHVLAARERAEKVAAAREEQRETIAVAVLAGHADSKQRQHLAGLVRATPLVFTPLADRIKEQSLTIETLGESNARLLRERDEAAADLATATSLAKTLTEERDAAEAAERELLSERTAAWGLLNVEQNSRIADARVSAEQLLRANERFRLQSTAHAEEFIKLEAALAAETALTAALQAEMNSTRTAHAATVMRVTVLENALRRHAQLARLLAVGSVIYTEAHLERRLSEADAALEVKPEPLPSQVKEAITDFYEKRVKP